MATTEHQDSIYAYYFYRLIARAKRVYMLYDSRTTGLKRGEMSRFVYQLKHHYAHLLPQYKIEEYAVAHDVSIDTVTPISIPKEGGVAQRLRQFLKDSNSPRPLSASSVKTYINCPLQFYLQHVEKMQTDDEISESVDSSAFGSIYHNVMADIYDEMKAGKESVTVTREIIDEVLNREGYIEGKIDEHFNIIFLRRKNKERFIKPTGKNQIVAHTIYLYVVRTLEYDRDMFAPFVYEHSEMRLDGDLFLPLKNGKEVRFKALIDRVDRAMITTPDKNKEERIRIIDYKTGKDEVKCSNLENIFNSPQSSKLGAIFQVLLYCKLYRIKYPANGSDNTPLQPLIYKLRTAFSDLAPTLSIEKTGVNNYDDVKEEYEEMLNKCLEELFDESIPFVQTDNIKHCEHCNFKTICKRQVSGS